MQGSSQFRLLAERRFGPFFGVQFLGAFNDNVFKQALVILLAYQTASFTAMSSDTLQNLAQALFILPFFLFSATAGQIADKFEKSALITITVAIELAVMALGAVGLFTQSLALLLGALFLGGVQSALFGPVKYAILPQHLNETEIVGGNGMVEMGTSIAILLGMVYGGWMITQPGWGVAGVAVSAMAISAAGIVLSRFIPRSPAPSPDLRINWNPLHRDLAQPQVHVAEPHRLALHPRHLLVLVLRRNVHHPVPEPVEKRARRERARGDAAAGRVLGGHRRGFAAVRATLGQEGGDRPGALRLDRPHALRRGPVARRRDARPAWTADARRVRARRLALADA